jgi:hypothetical protein
MDMSLSLDVLEMLVKILQAEADGVPFPFFGQANDAPLPDPKIEPQRGLLLKEQHGPLRLPKRKPNKQEKKSSANPLVAGVRFSAHAGIKGSARKMSESSYQADSKPRMIPLVINQSVAWKYLLHSGKSQCLM